MLRPWFDQVTLESESVEVDDNEVVHAVACTGQVLLTEQPTLCCDHFTTSLASVCYMSVFFHLVSCCYVYHDSLLVLSHFFFISHHLRGVFGFLLKTP
jgi:hypothetical protein